MLLFVCFIFFLPSFSLSDFKNRSKIFSAVDRDVTTFRFPLIPVRVTSSPKWLSSFILTYFSVYGVSAFKYSFNFSHKSVTVICLLFSVQYPAQATSYDPAVCISVERRKATGMLFFFCSEVNVPLAVVQYICARFLPVCPVAIE